MRLSAAAADVHQRGLRLAADVLDPPGEVHAAVHVRLAQCDTRTRSEQAALLRESTAYPGARRRGTVASVAPTDYRP